MTDAGEFEAQYRVEWDDDDVRIQELESLKAIYEELEYDPKTFEGCIMVKVCPLVEPKIRCISRDSVKETGVKYFPSLQLKFKLGEKYPYYEGPELDLRSLYNWVPPKTLCALKQKCQDTYEQLKDLCVFSIVDLLNEEASNSFGISGPYETVDEQLYDRILSFNDMVLSDDFDKETFICEICQTDKKGTDCVRIPKCEHVFCKQCFEDYLVSCINNDQVAKLHCPNYSCLKKFETDNKVMKKYAAGNVILASKDVTLVEVRQLKKNILEPYFEDHFIKQVLSRQPQMYEKYQTLSHAKKIDRFEHYFPGKTNKCPSSLCGKQFVINESREVADYQRLSSIRLPLTNHVYRTENAGYDDDDDEEDFAAEKGARLLLICPFCRYAYCSQCRHSWHGTNNMCSFTSSEISKAAIQKYLDAPEGSSTRTNMMIFYGRKLMRVAVSQYLADKEFKKFLEQDSGYTKCPGCQAVTERIDGCNKMECSQCQTRFCNICGTNLSYGNPYDHFNEPMSPCFRKLFDGLVSEEI